MGNDSVQPQSRATVPRGGTRYLIHTSSQSPSLPWSSESQCVLSAGVTGKNMAIAPQTEEASLPESAGPGSLRGLGACN